MNWFDPASLPEKYDDISPFTCVFYIRQKSNMKVLALKLHYISD